MSRQPFIFAGEAALQYRRMQIEREETALQECQREVRYWEYQVGQQERGEVVRHTARACDQQLAESRARARQQELRGQAARRQHELLQRHKAKALAEWERAAHPEEDSLAAPVYVVHCERVPPAITGGSASSPL